MHASPTCAIVVYHGVLVDEAEVLRFVLSRLPDFQTVTVGAARGQVMGLGGAQFVEATLDEIGSPDIIAVPGGIGCHRRTDIANWLRGVSPTWILASSTGSALLAAAGKLHDATAATHWLAGPLLERHGAHPSDKQVVVNGAIITCSGCSSAFRAALVVADAHGGQELVARIRAQAAAAREGLEPLRRRSLWARLRHAARLPSQTRSRARTPLEQALDESEVFHLGQVTPGKAPGQCGRANYGA